MTPRRMGDPVLEGGIETDIVIPVMGLTKGGRSTFLNSLIGWSKFEVGKKLASCTAHVSSHVMEKAPSEYIKLNRALDGRRIVLVDTPGFDYTRLEDEEVLRRISEWLVASYRNGMRVGGVIYIHDISRDDFSRTSHVNLNMFSGLCGSSAMKRVAFVTTKWDRLKNTREGLDRVENLKADFWGYELLHGALVYHVQPQGGGLISPEHRAPWDIIHQLVAARRCELPINALQIQDEIVNRGHSLHDTAAGRVLRTSLESLRKVAQRLMRLERESNVRAQGGQAEADAARPGVPEGDVSHFQGNKSDVVLFVVGGVGVGKSAFVNHVLDGAFHTDPARANVDESLYSCTLTIEPVRLKPSNSDGRMGQVVLVDGPGFDDQFDLKNKKELMDGASNWLRRHYPTEHLPRRGIVYVVDISREPSDISRIVEFLNLQATIYLSTEIQSGDILLLTTKWGKRKSASQDQEAEGLLRKQALFRNVVEAGYQIFRIEDGTEKESALSAIQYFLEGSDTHHADNVAQRYHLLLENKLLQKLKTTKY